MLRVLGTTNVGFLVFNHFGSERSAFAEQHHVSTSAHTRHFKFNCCVLFHHTLIMHEMEFTVNRLFGNPGIDQAAQDHSSTPGVK